MELWSVGLFAVSCIAIGAAVLVAPSHFKSKIIDLKLKRDRVLGAGVFFLLAVFAALMAVTFYPHFVTSWSSDCFSALYAFMAFSIWVGIALEALARRHAAHTPPPSSEPRFDDNS